MLIYIRVSLLPWLQANHAGNWSLTGYDRQKIDASRTVNQSALVYQCRRATTIQIDCVLHLVLNQYICQLYQRQPLVPDTETR
jgi:hypothetical protein